MPELLDKVKASGDPDNLIDMFNNHELVYVPNGGSLDLRNDISRVIYDDKLSPMENILVFPGGQIAIQTAVMALHQIVILSYSHLDINRLYSVGCMEIWVLPKSQDGLKIIGKWNLRNYETPYNPIPNW